MTIKTYVGFIRDHSASMRGLEKAAMADFNAQLAGVQAEVSNGHDLIVSVVECGSTDSRDLPGVSTRCVNSSATSIPAMTSYVANGGSTPLRDSIMKLTGLMKSVPDANDANVAFLVNVFTDGAENTSRTLMHVLQDELRRLQQTGRWTFVLRGPQGHQTEVFARSCGIPVGNVLPWETTVAGLRESTVKTTSGFSGYANARRSGATSTDKFYTNMTDVSAADVKAALVDISSQVEIWLTAAKEVVRPYCERMSKSAFIKGAAFYQLTKTEPEVQDYKLIIIRDKKSGAVYSGVNARQMLGLPSYGNAYVKPGDHGQFDIYIQSTSINRVLPPGTSVMYWPNVSATPVAVQPAAPVIAKKTKPVKKPVTPVTRLTTPAVGGSALQSAEYIRGYKEGFPDGKSKKAQRAQPDTDFGRGYARGYKDGRGKQKRLYK